MRYVVVAIMLCMSAPAFACLVDYGAFSSYLTELPDEAMQKDVVAKVLVLEEGNEQSGPNSGEKVKVIEAIKGTHVGDVLEVIPSSCGEFRKMNGADIRGKEFYIAGDLHAQEKGSVFTGSWRVVANKDYPVYR